MRLNEIRLSKDGKCQRISYVPSKDDILPDMEHFSAGLVAGKRRIHIASLGADFTFAQIRTITNTLLRIVEDNK